MQNIYGPLEYGRHTDMAEDGSNSVVGAAALMVSNRDASTRELAKRIIRQHLWGTFHSNAPRHRMTPLAIALESLPRS